ncbi:alpha/beta hydrolase-fold protein [Terrabacter sp. NPDC000476]|uniref:alpha/beta hydrolase n=1 Tax=Terrabacter sp. NPDC000476 TaxID=3154258 RepID=UPI00331E9D6D
MELTDTSLLVLLGALALGVFALVVAGLPRRGGRPLQAVARGLQVLVLNVLVLALAGAALNDQYVFYSSWGDLFGSRSTSVQVHHGGSSTAVVAASVAGPGFRGMTTPAVLPPLPRPGSRLQTYTVVDQRSNAEGQVYVHLPVGYDPRSPRTYPVILGLHGFPSGPRGFLRLNFLSTVDALTAEHRLAPSIVVVPRIDTPAGLDTECVNGAAGEPQTDTWLSHDIPAWTARHFHVERTRTAWAALGYSYGAWCAASLSMRHPDVFGAAISLLGYFRPDFSPAYDPLTPATERGYDLVDLARTSPPPVALWVLTSREDTLSYPTTSRFLSVARPPLDVTGTVLAHGGHRDSVFTPFVPQALTWLGQTMPGFRG